MSEKLYRIKKGQHYARPFSLGFHWDRDRFSYSAIISPLNTYAYVPNSPKSEQINKLFGFSEGFARHRNEFRLGWRYNKEGTADLFCYFYKDGIRPSLGVIEDKYKLTTVELGAEFITTILRTKNSVIFLVSGDCIPKSITIPHKRTSRFGWKLRPYNGGRETYDNDFYFVVNEWKKGNIPS